MPSTSCIACVRCGLFMKPIKTGQIVEELDGYGEPYKVWSCDEFACDECGARVVTRFASTPIVEQFQPEYAAVRTRAAYRLR
jgi:hypothetical protein